MPEQPMPALEPELTKWDRRVLRALDVWTMGKRFDEIEALSTWQVAQKLDEEDVKYVRETLRGLHRFHYVIGFGSGLADRRKHRWVATGKGQEARS